MSRTSPNWVTNTPFQSPSLPAGLDEALTCPALTVIQQKQWGEILTNWETRNRYHVHAPDERLLFVAGEIPGGIGAFFLRQFLRNSRPFTLEIRNPAGETVFRVRRPWTLFFARAEIYDSNDHILGTVQQRFALFTRRYSMTDASGAPLAELHGPLFHPWTFKILTNGQDAGAIRKQWSGLLKETFTSADHFGIEFGPSLDPTLKLLCLGATFLIDFVHFETRR